MCAPRGKGQRRREGTGARNLVLPNIKGHPTPLLPLQKGCKLVPAGISCICPLAPAVLPEVSSQVSPPSRPSHPQQPPTTRFLSSSVTDHTLPSQAEPPECPSWVSGDLHQQGTEWSHQAQERGVLCHLRYKARKRFTTVSISVKV